MDHLRQLGIDARFFGFYAVTLGAGLAGAAFGAAIRSVLEIGLWGLFAGPFAVFLIGTWVLFFYALLSLLPAALVFAAARFALRRWSVPRQADRWAGAATTVFALALFPVLYTAGLRDALGLPALEDIRLELLGLGAGAFIGSWFVAGLAFAGPEPA